MSAETGSENEISNLLGKWKEEHQKPNYDPIPFLTKCSEILEGELTEFHKGDPDPFDQRHPKYVLPGCKFGKLLSTLESCNEFADKMTSTYLKTQQSPKNVEHVVIAAARLALSTNEGYTLSGIDTEEWMEVLISWIIYADEPLRTYATGLIDGQYVIQKANNNTSIHLISVLLKRLWNYIEHDKYNDPECVVATSEHKKDIINAKKRKLSSEMTIGVPIPKKIHLDTPKKTLLETDQAESMYENDLSNSSWAEQMPVMLGQNYSLEPPLAATLCQSYMFGLMKCFGEFQDFLSTFLKWNVLDLINIFLKNKSEGHLTFKVLDFLSSLLCHNKVATNFIEIDGIQSLLHVPRPSMGSTGVALCLYNLAYKKEAMERVCLPQAQVLKELIKYAIWLLECSHESGRSHIALFFSVTLSYRSVLHLFDSMNGLRCLVNLVSTARPITRASDDDYDPLEDDDLAYIASQIIRSVCVALRKYFEAHVIFRASQAVKSCSILKQKFTTLDSTTKYESTAHSREQYFEYFDILRDLAEKSSSFSLESWSPIALFQRLDGVPLLLKIVNMASELDTVTSQVDIARAALDVLCVVTLSRTCQMMLTKRYPNLGLNYTGLSVIQNYITAGEDYEEELSEHNDGVAMNSAIAVLANCTWGPFSKSDEDVETPRTSGTPKHRKKRKGKETLCKLIQQNDGIKMLLSLLEISAPAQTADETRYFACKALIGIADYKPVRQILSKLQLFVNGKLLSTFKEPVLKDKKQLHSKLCAAMEVLLKKVTGKAITLDADLKTVNRTDIVSETRVQYDNKDVLLLIYNHLKWSKLDNIAEALAQQSGLNMDVDDGSYSTPKIRRSYVSQIDGGGDKQNKITFSRGDRASAVTPTSSSVLNLRTPSSQKRVAKINMSSAHQSVSGRDRFTLSRNGFVTVHPKVKNKSRPTSPITLNSIIEEHFKHQHSKCRNPVVTVPQFSLFAPHHCPEPRNKIEAASNVTKRLHYRQGVCPKWGGVGGADNDLRFIYSRFKPARLIKPNEDRKTRITSATFLPNREGCVVVGDSAGNIQFSEPYPYKERVVQGISDSSIIHLESSKLGDVMLSVSPTYWSSNCSLLAINERMDVKLTFDDIDYVEFSKTIQDKIIGTRESKAIVFDANTGATLDTYEKEDLSCDYKMNCATFSYDDRLILCDGLLWDTRKPPTSPIHKFDKFNPIVSGIFHPNGSEIIINTEVWDMRNFNLLRTVSAFDQCDLQFNSSHSVIYAVKTDNPERDLGHNTGMMSAFQTFDSYSYNQIGFISIKQLVCSVTLDECDRNIAVIEMSGTDESVSVCRLYEVGMVRDDDDEEEENVDSNYEDGSSDDDATSLSSPSDDESSMYGNPSSYEDPFSDQENPFSDQERSDESIITDDSEWEDVE